MSEVNEKLSRQEKAILVAIIQNNPWASEQVIEAYILCGRSIDELLEVLRLSGELNYDLIDLCNAFGRVDRARKRYSNWYSIGGAMRKCLEHFLKGRFLLEDIDENIFPESQILGKIE